MEEKKINNISSVCVYCASSTKIPSVYFDAAKELGRLLGERKQLMANLSDAVIALPGGCGTLEELLEIITWKQLGLYLNPIVILNINHYYDPLLELLRNAMNENFMRPQHAKMWAVADTPEEAIRLIHAEPKWDASLRKIAAI